MRPADAAAPAVEGDNVIAPRRAVMEHEHFPAAFGAEIEQIVSSTPQKAREIEVARLKGASVTTRAAVLCPHAVLYI
jgi:hypothetical protein